MPSITIADLRVDLAEHGPATGDPVFLIHGWPDDATTWDGVAPVLAAAGRRVLVPTLRGFGDTRFTSDAAPRTGDSGILAMEVIALADALGVERFAVAGGLFAGLGLSAMLVAGERKAGKSSELADLERAGAARLGLDAPAPGSPAPDTLPSPREQAGIQGGHLLLSAMAGAAYAAVTDEDAGVLSSGIAFGLAFYGLAHWVAGPALGLKQPEWRSDTSTIAMHATNHLLFGLVTAAGAKAATRI